MKKIYISGAITGLPEEEVRAKFNEAEKNLTEQGFEVVSPLGTGGKSVRLSWENHMAIDILLLMGCDAVYLLPDWEQSKGATLEKAVAEQTGKELIYEKVPVFVELKQAIREATGIRFGEIMGKSRKRPIVYARMIYAHLCRMQNASPDDIAEEMKHSVHTVNYYLGKFWDDMKYTPAFRETVKRVEGALKQTITNL